jgi:protein-S-isoprenylcysteine O-methyltransferase Ste14
LLALSGSWSVAADYMWPTPWNAQRYIGTALAWWGASGGIALARYQLGKSFSIKPEAHALVTSGVYSKIRNPDLRVSAR